MLKFLSQLSQIQLFQKYDYVIIGGGIAGLYCAYRLIKDKNISNICIIESSDRLGGRVYTHKFNDSNVELGAGIFKPEHKTVFKLVEELGLSDKLKSFTQKKSYNISIDNNFNLDDFSKQLKIMVDNNIINKEINYSLFRYIELKFDIKTAILAELQNGYTGDFDMNAWDGINMLISNINKTKHSLKGGLNQIIDKLEEFLIKHNCKIIKNTSAEKIEYNSVITNNGILHAKNIILAIPQEQILKLLPKTEILDSVTTKPLFRLYLKVDKHDIKNTLVTDTVIRQIIPMNDHLLMIYCSGSSAEELNYWKKSKTLLQNVKKALEKININLNILDSIDIYWKNATHIWRPTFDSDIVSKEILTKYEPIYIVGESYSKTQQWIEGALSSVDELIIKLKPIQEIHL